jgi:hypothetical protein
MSVEAVSVLIEIGLQIMNGMVNAFEPVFEHHDTAMQLGEIFPFLLRFFPGKLRESGF